MFLGADNWIRKDQIAAANDATGVQGTPALATAELGKLYLDMKVDECRQPDQGVSRQRTLGRVGGLATTRQHRCNGNCEILVTAETFGLTVDVTRNGGKR